MARYNIYLPDDTMAQLRALWRATFPHHGLKFGQWLAAPRVKELQDYQ